MDIVFMGRGTTNLYTTWTPLGDIPLEMGGLMILERSHQHERLNNGYGRKDVDKYCVNHVGEGYTKMGGGGNIVGERGHRGLLCFERLPAAPSLPVFSALQHKRVGSIE